MDVKYRRFQKQDFFYLASISDDEYKNVHINVARSMLECNNDSVTLCFVAIKDEHIVGYIYGFALPNKLLIPEFVYVKQEHRQKGIGGALLQILESESNCENSMIFYNKLLHNHYQKLGYERKFHADPDRRTRTWLDKKYDW